MSRAFFEAAATRDICVELPEEALSESEEALDLVCHLKMSLYGTRDAGAIWEETYASALVDMGFTRGVASPCCFYHADQRLMIVVHGDDFTFCGEGKDLDWVEAQVRSWFEVMVRARLGVGAGVRVGARVGARVRVGVNA